MFHRISSPTGQLSKITGHATATDSPGKFKIYFDSGQSGNYWITALGEVPEGQDKYPWAVVSVPYETSLYILARDVEEFRNQYEDEVLALVKEQGFIYFYNKPLETYQGDNCLYSE